jgi:hypothetical protein
MASVDEVELPLEPRKVAELLTAASEKADRLEGWLHPLGFWHIKLGESRNGKVRLHIWPRAIPVRSVGDVPRVHNHAFSFSSQVIAGRVMHVPYSVSASPTGPLQTFRMKYSGASSIMVPTRQYCSIRQGRVRRYIVGDVYSMPAGAFHDAAGLEELTATILVEGAGHGVRSIVIGHRKMVWLRKFLWQTATKDVLRELLAGVRDRVLGAARLEGGR